MFKPIPFANAAAFVAVLSSLVCWVSSLTMPDLAFGVVNSWFHLVDLTLIRTSSPDLTKALLGVVSLGAVVWVFAYLFAECYRYMSKGK
jgi:hypothetical protein